MSEKKPPSVASGRMVHRYSKSPHLFHSHNIHIIYHLLGIIRRVDLSKKGRELIPKARVIESVYQLSAVSSGQMGH